MQDGLHQQRDDNAAGVARKPDQGCGAGAGRPEEALTLAAIGRHRVDDAIAGHQIPPVPSALFGNSALAPAVGDGGASREVLSLVGADHVHHSVDQGQVGEGLRKVAEVTAGARVYLLGVQTEW
jgi:hypothetical protein